MAHEILQQALALWNAGRPAEAVPLIRQAAATGHPEALFILADLTWSGNQVPQDPPRGRLLFEHASSFGHPEAGPVATNLLGNGVAGARNWPAALERLAAEARHLPQRDQALGLIRAMPLDDEGDPLTLPEPERLADRPDIRMYKALVTPAECAYLISVAAALYEPSFVFDETRTLVRDTIRTSDGAALHWLIEDPAIHAINRRIGAISGTPYENGEPLQALRYQPGQEYRPHFDFVADAENRRMWTALIYLNEDYEGGGTAFPHIGLEVRGRTGDVLLFGNATPEGNQEPLAEHAGLPVTSGTKYLATRWIREARWIV